MKWLVPVLMMLMVLSVDVRAEPVPTITPEEGRGWSKENISGTDWSYNVNRIDGRIVQCDVDKKLKSNDSGPWAGERIFTFALMSKGSPVIALQDPYIREPLSTTSPSRWTPDSTPAVMLTYGRDFWKKSETIMLEGQLPWRDTLVVPLPKDKRLREIYNSNRLYVIVGGLSSRGYDVPNLGKAVQKLKECPLWKMEK